MSQLSRPVTISKISYAGSMTETKKQQPKRKKSFPHTRAIQRDRQKRPSAAPPDEVIEEWLEETLQPAALNQIAYFRQLGLRERTLSLPIMVAFMVSLIWRQLGAVREAVRVLREQGMLCAAGGDFGASGAGANEHAASRFVLPDDDGDTAADAGEGADTNTPAATSSGLCTAAFCPYLVCGWLGSG
jgi:hypothetical protein